MITKDIEYLIGVDEKHIADFDAMKEKYGTEFRNLNILRSAIISNFHEVNDAYKDGTSLSDIDVTASVVKDLSLEYFFDRKDKSLSRYVIWINKRIESQCPEFSDSEINPEWIKNMFTMENGDTVEGVQAAVTRYTQFRQYYPFQKYINWDFSRTKEEIRKKYFLKTDEDFSNNLERYYAQDNSWVDFTSNGRKSTVVIDCENGNPSATVAALLPISDRLEKVVLINDDCASGLWSEFQKKLLLEGVFVCEEKLPRLKAQKSLVDLRMAARILEEYFRCSCRKFILVTSDSDIWSVIPSVIDSEILVLSEKELCGDLLVDVLTQHDIPCVYLNDVVDKEDYKKLQDETMEKILADLDSAPRTAKLEPGQKVIIAAKKLNIYLADEEIEKYSNYLNHELAESELEPEM